MTWQQIWAIVQSLIGHLHDPAHWKASKDGQSVGPVTAATFTPTDARMEFGDGDAARVLEARPGSPDHADVYLDGTLQPNARLVVAIKSQFPFKPLIVVLVFKHVAVGGAIHDYRFDNPK